MMSDKTDYKKKFMSDEDKQQDIAEPYNEVPPFEMETNDDDTELEKSEPKKHKRICCMGVKKDTTCFNLLAIMLIKTAATTGESYYNANLIFMMRDPDYFALSPSSYVA
jgi:hypothetical protein